MHAGVRSRDVSFMQKTPDEDCDRGDGGDCAIPHENLLDHRRTSFQLG